MRIIGFTEEETRAVLQMVAAVLKLGNVTFSPRLNADNTDGSDVATLKGA